MTTGFLNTLAEYFIDDLKANSSEFCFIFPSQRSSIFFLNHLRDFCDEPYWAPQTITINNFIASLSNKAIADNITLLFTLHAVYNNVTKKDVSFDEFLPWGEMFLNDFGDLDKYLIPIDQLYANLSSLKELEDDYSHLSPEQIEAIQSFWNAFDPQKLSQDQKEFLSIWEQIPEIYLQFKKALAKDEIGFEGMIYREIAEFIKAENHPELHHKKYVFVGLNALTPAEKAVMTYLQKRKLAIFFWDYSHHILPEKSDVDTGLDKSKGPGLFIRQNRNNFV